MFRANPVVRNTTFHDMITYMALTGLLLLFNMSGAGDRIAHRILQGSISTDLIRPYNLKLYIFSQTTGDNLAHFLLFVLPVYTGVLILFGMQTPPPSSTSLFLSLLWSTAPLFPSIIITSWECSLSGSSPTGTSGLWITPCLPCLPAPLSPIWFYPDFLVKISYYLPFRYITYEAVTFYLGRTGLPEMAGVLLEAIGLDRDFAWAGSGFVAGGPEKIDGLRRVSHRRGFFRHRAAGKYLSLVERWTLMRNSTQLRKKVSMKDLILHL